jgi:hypothetical protein
VTVGLYVVYYLREQGVSHAGDCKALLGVVLGGVNCQLWLITL